MSITFTYAASDGASTYIGIPCSCPRWVDPLDPDSELLDPCEHKRHELNVCNGNGLTILQRLGLPVDYSGEVDPLVLLERLSTPSAGRLSRYYLTKLRDLAADAVQRHVMVGWA